MPEVVELREVTDRRDIIHRAVQQLSAGELVGLPSEAGYVLAASALAQEVGQRFGRDRGTTTLLLGSSDEMTDFLPRLAKSGLRIAKRCWPGPLVLRGPVTADEGFLAALPEESRSALVIDGQLSVRVSSHPVLSEVAKLLRGPLLIRKIDAPPKNSDLSALPWSSATLIVKDGSAPNMKPADANAAEYQTTIVRVDSSGQWSIERGGAIPEHKLKIAACELILFCCTGNTCRSPMAESLCRHLLAERLKCSPEQLTERGFLIASAGLSADYGYPASPESVDIMRRRGLDLKAHSSQPLTDRLMDQADRCYAMTKAHRQAIIESRPDLADRVQLLARDGTDIPDPIGGTIEDYAACAASIEKNLVKILDEII